MAGPKILVSAKPQTQSGRLPMGGDDLIQSASPDPDRDDPDAILMARIREGDSEAVRDLIARKLPRLLGLGRKLLGDQTEAEDMAQEAFFRIWKHAGRWQPERSRFDTWMHRIALNLCYDRLRRRKDLLPGEMPELVDPEPLAEARLTEADTVREREQAVMAALARLPDRQRAALTLQYYQGLSNIETAEVMGLSIEAVESLLARGRRALRTALASFRSVTQSAPGESQ